MPRTMFRLVIVVVLALALVGCVGAEAPGWTFGPTLAPSLGASTSPPPSANVPPSAPPASPATSDAHASPAADKIEIEAFDLGFKPAAVSVPAAGTYDVTFHNTGAIPHDITFADGTKIPAAPGATETGTVSIPAGGLTFICSIPGHEQAGMKGAVSVAGTAPPPAPAPAPGDGGHGGPLPSADVAADPNAPAPVTYDATAPKLLPGTVHDIDLVMTEQEMTVAPGFVQKV